jgi:pilus assembly protein Flp/PilA
MHSIIRYVTKLVRREEGVTALEYGLIAALIAVAIIGAVQAVGGGVSNTFNTIASKL